MTDILIRGVPAEIVAALDARARRLGLSRAEFLKRQLMAVAARPARPVGTDDLDWFGATFADLDDPDIMTAAWR